MKPQSSRMRPGPRWRTTYSWDVLYLSRNMCSGSTFFIISLCLKILTSQTSYITSVKHPGWFALPEGIYQVSISNVLWKSQKAPSSTLLFRHNMLCFSSSCTDITALSLEHQCHSPIILHNEEVSPQMVFSFKTVMHWMNCLVNTRKKRQSCIYMWFELRIPCTTTKKHNCHTSCTSSPGENNTDFGVCKWKR